jgi:hypothetical protein
MTGLDWRGCAGATAVAICAAATGVSGCAQTIEPPPPFPEFTQAGLDHDNTVTRQEWMTAGVAKFDALDSDHDGTLSGEIEATARTLDQDHDGTLATDEVRPGVAALDTDGDGVIGKDEFQNGLIKNLGGDEGATGIQRDQVIRQLDRQFDAADAQAPAQVIDDGDRVQDASMLHFLLYQFD